MAITKDNVVIAYCSSDADSESLADHYISIHGLDSSQKIALPCSSTVEILSSETEFNTQVLTPLKTAIDTLVLGGDEIFAVVLGLNVPGGFYHNGDIISSTSRISRINHSFSKKLRNTLYDRKSFKLFDSADADFALIASRIDAPTLTLAKEIIDRGESLARQYFVSGKFYLDPYSDRHLSGSDKYQNLLLNFESRVLPKLNLETETTIFLDPYIDVVIPFVKDDSFVWSWFTDRSSLSFFKDTNNARVFFYNADFDGAETIRDISDRRWPVLALQSGYFSTASAMSNPDIDGFLNPSAFFNTILRGGTIGEAYLFSLPFLDWTMTFFGDPLVLFSFNNNDILDTNIDPAEAVRLMSRDLARSIAYYIRKSDFAEEARDAVVLSHGVNLATSSLVKMVEFSNYNGTDRTGSIYGRVADQLSRYVVNISKNKDVIKPNLLFNDYLTINNIKISELVDSVYSNNITIDSNNIIPQGEWDIEIDIRNEIPGFTFYHFELEVYRDEELTDLKYSIDSKNDYSNWIFEEEENEFSTIDPIGVSSNFAGRRIKYISKETEYLTRADIYYFRIRQKDADLFFDYREFSDIVFT